MDRRMVKMIGFAGMLVLALGLVVTGEDKAVEKPLPKFADQPTGIRRLFEKQAPNWVKIGDKLWSIEVMNEAKKRAKSKRGKAYQDESAPWFYEPIEGTRCRRIGDVYKHMKLDPPDGYEVLEGRTSKTDSGKFYFLPRKQNKNITVTTGHVNPAVGMPVVLLINKIPTDEQVTNAGGYVIDIKVYHQVKISDLAKTVSSVELFAYFVSRQIKKIPVWRSKPNRERNGFEWNNYPRKFKLPN